MGKVRNFLLAIYLSCSIVILNIFYYAHKFSYIDPFSGTTLAQAYIVRAYYHLITTHVPHHTNLYIDSLLVIPGLMLSIHSLICKLSPSLLLYTPIPMILFSTLLYTIQREIVKSYKRFNNTIISLLLIVNVLFIVFIYLYTNIPLYEYHGIKYVYYLLLIYTSIKILTINSKVYFIPLCIFQIALTFTHYRFFLSIPLTFLMLYIICRAKLLLYLALITGLIELLNPIVELVLSQGDIITALKRILITILTLKQHVEKTSTITPFNDFLYTIMVMSYKICRGIYTLLTILIVIILTRKLNLYVKAPLSALTLFMLIGSLSIILPNLGYAIASNGALIPTIGPQTAWLSYAGIAASLLMLNSYTNGVCMKLYHKIALLCGLVISSILVLLIYILFIISKCIYLNYLFDIVVVPPPFDEKVHATSSFLVIGSKDIIRIESSIFNMFSVYMGVISINTDIVAKGLVTISYGYMASSHSLLLVSDYELRNGLYLTLGNYINPTLLRTMCLALSLIYSNGRHFIYC